MRLPTERWPTLHTSTRMMRLPPVTSLRSFTYLSERTQAVTAAAVRPGAHFLGLAGA